MKTFTLFLFSALLLISCNNDKKKEELNTSETGTSEAAISSTSDCEKHLLERKHQNLNISVFVDLSDRIDQPRQRFNDSAYIRSLALAFNEHIKSKKLGLLYDKMEFFFDPTPSNQKINSLSEELKISYVRDVSKNEWMPKTLQLYDSIPSEIYRLAIEDGKSKGYIGSDIWGFMKNHIKDYSIDSCRRNILVILTDGYMFHEQSKRRNKNRTSYLTPKSMDLLNLNTENWKDIMENKDLGFIPATENLNDLEVLVLGITNENPRNPYSNDIIEAYWTKWMTEMNVANFKIKTADIPSRIEKVIFDFIKTENHGI